MFRWGQAQDIIYSIYSMDGETGTQSKRYLQPLSALTAVPDLMQGPQTLVSLFFIVSLPFSLWSDMFKMELVIPLLPPHSPPASRGHTQNYCDHASPQPTHH